MVGMSASRFPDYPHPAVEHLEELDFDVLPEGFFTIVYGARRTGKTHSIAVQLEKIKNRFDFAYLFSDTATLHNNDKNFYNFDMIREEAKFPGFDEEVLTRIIDRQKAVMQHNNECKLQRDKKPNKTLIIFDDFVHNKGIRYSKVFTDLPVLGRHYDISVICLSQGYSQVASGGLNGATRMNADMVMTFLPRNSNDVERISEWYLTKDKHENNWFVKTACEEKHRMVAIDLTQPHETEFENYCYIYVAPAEIPKYELGKVQWKIANEERKRQRQVTLSASLENERAYFLDSDEIGKRQRIGEATGRPANKGRMSLFDAVMQSA